MVKDTAREAEAGFELPWANPFRPKYTADIGFAVICNSAIENLKAYDPKIATTSRSADGGKQRMQVQASDESVAF